MPEGWGEADRRQIVALLQGLAAQTHRFLCCFQTAGGGGRATIQGDFGAGGEPGFTPMERGNRLAGGAFREQRHLQLFYGITVVMPEKCQIHSLKIRIIPFFVL